MESPSQFYQVLHRSPCVVYCKVPWVDYFAPRFEVDQPVAILAATNWKLEREDKRKAMDWAKYQEQKYGHYIEFLLDREDEIELFERYGLNVTHVNPNALLDERVYRILPRQKHYEAVYTARPSKHKRIKLCEQIEGTWLWLTYDTETCPKFTREALGMPNVYAPQFDGDRYTGYINREEIPGWLCQSRCGLALSDLEGSNYAAVEYLLCGIPVVATPGECTRDQLFDDRTSITVKPNMYSVAQAVKDSHDLARCVRPETIRQITLDLMRPHRERFVAAVRRAYEAVGIDHDPAFDLFHLFRHQMTFWQPVENVLKGGNAENQELLKVASDEPHTRKLWASLSGRYWEHALPEPVA